MYYKSISLALLTVINSIPVLGFANSEQELAHIRPMIFEPFAGTDIVHNKTDQQYLDYAWRSFIALNWPTKQVKVDLSKQSYPVHNKPVVWETWPYTAQAFLPSGNWKNYPEWNQLPVTALYPIGAGKYKAAAKPDCMDQVKRNNAILLQAINQPNTSIKAGSVGPLFDQNGYSVRYQIGLNQTYFNYVKSNKYYNADNQDPDKIKPLPIDQRGSVGMIEYKSAWKVLTRKEQISGRFYTRTAYFLGLPTKSRKGRLQAGTCFKTTQVQPPSHRDSDGFVYSTVGLVAFHIHRKTYFGHVAMTFEQVDNVKRSLKKINDSKSLVSLTPSFNPGIFSSKPPPYGKKGYSGIRPDRITTGNQYRNKKSISNISRATEIPFTVQQTNTRYQKLMQKMNNNVLQYYQLIGAEHANASCSRNIKTGKWSTGCPTPNLVKTSLINVALESYTQLVDLNGNLKTYSCRGCHLSARPCGVSWDSPENHQKPEIHLMSFLLSKAFKEKTTYQQALDDYNCNK